MPELDDKARLLEYLRQQQERRKRQDDPAYRQSVNADLMGAQNVASKNNLAALLMDSASLAGTIGGKRADASGVARFAQAQNDALGDFRRGMAGAEADRENRYQMDAKVREYLAAKQQAGEDRAATAKYRTDTLAQNAASAKAREAGERSRFNATQGLEREKMAQAAALKREELAAATNKVDDKPATDAQLTAVNFGRKAQDADSIIRQIEAQGYKPGEWGRHFRNAQIPLVGGKPYATEHDRQYEAAQKAFIAAILRKESGGAITSEEFTEYGAIYFPQPGEGDAVIAQKAAKRKADADALISVGGEKAAGQIKNSPFTIPALKPAPGSAVAAPASSPAPPPPGKVRVLSPDGKPGFIPVEQLQDALKEGYQEVK